MSAYITGSTTKFNDEDTIALFVEQLADSDKIMNLYRIERNVPEKKALYQPEMIVSTVKRLLQECAPRPYTYYPKKAAVEQIQMEDVKQQDDEESQDEEEEYSPPPIPGHDEASFENQVMINAINAVYSNPNLLNTPQCIICSVLSEDKEKCKHLFKDCPMLNNIPMAKQMWIELAAFFNKVQKQQKKFNVTTAQKAIINKIAARIKPTKPDFQKGNRLA